jgi:hypothetical protein
MHKSAMKCNGTLGKWCKNKHGASKIIDTFETYQPPFEMKNWTYNPKNTVGPVNALHRVKGELRDAGLTPQDIVACFISRRVSPLQRRSHKICQMSGAMDPT